MVNHIWHRFLWRELKHFQICITRSYENNSSQSLIQMNCFLGQFLHNKSQLTNSCLFYVNFSDLILSLGLGKIPINSEGNFQQNDIFKKRVHVFYFPCKKKKKNPQGNTNNLAPVDTGLPTAGNRYAEISLHCSNWYQKKLAIKQQI